MGSEWVKEGTCSWREEFFLVSGLCAGTLDAKLRNLPYKVGFGEAKDLFVMGSSPQLLSDLPL